VARGSGDLFQRRPPPNLLVQVLIAAPGVLLGSRS
jgi:hypothetical protein